MPGRKRTRTRKFSFVLDKACDEQTRSSILWYIEGSVCSLCISSRTNQSFGFRVRFCLRPGKWTAYNFKCRLRAKLWSNQLETNSSNNWYILVLRFSCVINNDSYQNCQLAVKMVINKLSSHWILQAMQKRLTVMNEIFLLHRKSFWLLVCKKPVWTVKPGNLQENNMAQ